MVRKRFRNINIRIAVTVVGIVADMEEANWMAKRKADKMKRIVNIAW